MTLWKCDNHNISQFLFLSSSLSVRKKNHWNVSKRTRRNAKSITQLIVCKYQLNLLIIKFDAFGAATQAHSNSLISCRSHAVLFLFLSEYPFKCKLNVYWHCCYLVVSIDPFRIVGRQWNGKYLFRNWLFFSRNPCVKKERWEKPTQILIRFSVFSPLSSFGHR